jgi:serine/threonine protein phosphatase 1
MGHLFDIGDIHGCYHQLIDLLGRIPIDWSRDRLVFMGDYIDRGPNSFEVVDYLVGLQARHRDIVFLKGNHEQMLADYLSGRDRMTYLFNGGRLTLESYLKHASPDAQYPIPPAHLQFFESLVMYFETENYIFVHAGLRQNLPLDQQSPEDLLWIREKFIHTKHSFGKRVIFGHTPLQEPLVQSNKIGIDTGAVYGNKLTCVQLPEELFYFSSQPASFLEGGEL